MKSAKRSVCKAFDSWLKTNRQRFNCEPMARYKRYRRKRYIIVRFRGRHHSISVGIRENGSIEIYFGHKGFTDILAEFDVSVKYSSSKGYYCELCADNGTHAYFETAALLMENHSFEPLLEWVNSNLTDDRVILVLATEDGSGEATIVEKKSSYTAKEWHVERFLNLLNGLRRCDGTHPDDWPYAEESLSIYTLPVVTNTGCFHS